MGLATGYRWNHISSRFSKKKNDQKKDVILRTLKRKHFPKNPAQTLRDVGHKVQW